MSSTASFGGASLTLSRDSEMDDKLANLSKLNKFNANLRAGMLDAVLKALNEEIELVDLDLD